MDIQLKHPLFPFKLECKYMQQLSLMYICVVIWRRSYIDNSCKDSYCRLRTGSQPASNFRYFNITRGQRVKNPHTVFFKGRYWEVEAWRVGGSHFILFNILRSCTAVIILSFGDVPTTLPAPPVQISLIFSSLLPLSAFYIAVSVSLSLHPWP